MRFRNKLVAAVFLAVVLAPSVLSGQSESIAPDHPYATGGGGKSYYVEISISGRKLWLYEKQRNGERIEVGEYPVGTAVMGLETYPLGTGKVTGIYFNPWWNPTPYSRYVFRKRGIELPPRVPPGHPLNYMGPFKIALSHRTWKGAIYRIHGNNDPKRVGRRVTGGCFVMNNDQGMELARKIKIGTEVNILP